MWQTVKSDVLVIGGGMAAARAAVEAAGRDVSVVLVDKGSFESSGTSPPSLNGIATTLGEGSPQILFKDLVEDGYHLNDQNLVWEAAKGAADNIYQLEKLGFVFRKEGNKYYFAHVVGHSAPYEMVYDYKASYLNPVSMVGKEAWRRGVKLCDHIMVTRLLKKGERAVGAVGFSPDGQCYHFAAKAVVLAAGGANHLFINTCERIDSRNFRTTGDAFALAFYTGAPLIDLEFSNFREGEGHRLARIGARLVNSRGEKIMERYAPGKLERAPRGKLVEAIATENYEGRGPVRWQMPPEIRGEDREHAEYFASIHGKNFEAIIDFQRLLGGARINHDAETNIKGLMAAGESAGGFHGADRMQGGGFLETTFFGARAGVTAAEFAKKASQPRISTELIEEELDRVNKLKGKIQAETVIQEVRKIMWEKVGVIRTESDLKEALERIESIRAEKVPQMSREDLFACFEAQNLALTGEMVIRAALMRQESRGFHRRRDYPDQNDELWRRHIAVYNRNGNVVLESLPVVTLSHAERYKLKL